MSGNIFIYIFVLNAFRYYIITYLKLETVGKLEDVVKHKEFRKSLALFNFMQIQIHS